MGQIDVCVMLFVDFLSFVAYFLFYNLYTEWKKDCFFKAYRFEKR